MMQEEYVTFETAKLLKEVGFPQDENFTYNSDGRLLGHAPIREYHCAAPTQTQAMRWLREEKEEFVCICFYSKAKGWFYEIVDIVNYRDNIYGSYFNSYESAAEEGIKAACKHLIDKGGEE